MDPKAKILSLSQLCRIVRQLKSRGKKIAFTNGTFDILHLGHVDYLEKAKKCGDVLIVGVNTDRSVKSYKDPSRPLNPEKDRIRVLAALQCVDYAVLFDEPTPLALILEIKPDVLVKGADWKLNQIAGAKEVLSWGGKVKRVSLVPGRSTTNLLGKAQNIHLPGKGSKSESSIPGWKKKAFKQFKLYGVTDVSSEDSSLFDKIESAYRGGADIVQLRSKNLSDATLIRIGHKIRKIADEHRKLFFVNDRFDLALTVGADGIHTGQDDLSVTALRHLFARTGISMWIGKSTHSLSQALRAQEEGADYIGVGPVFKTLTKPDYDPVGLDLVREISKKIKLPFVCIGGIQLDNIDRVLEAGGNRIAVVRAIFDAPDVYSAAKKLYEKIENHSSHV